MPKLFKIVFTFKFHPLHAKISTVTGTPVPDEKVKELSSTGTGLRATGVCGSTSWDLERSARNPRTQSRSWEEEKKS